MKQKFILAGLFTALSGAALLTGCGDTIVTTLSMPEYETADDLPECDELSNGLRVYVDDEASVYVCDAGKWRYLRQGESEERDTVATCSGEFYSVTEMTCHKGKYLLPICTDSLEGVRKEISDELSFSCYGGAWDKTSEVELAIGVSCTKKNDGETASYQYSNYVCRADSVGWVYDFDHLNFDSLEYGNRVYRTVGIGSQMWMAENLDYRDSVATPSLVGGRKCFQGSESLCEEYGSLYNWAATMNLPAKYNDSLAGDLLKEVHQGICPDGWHIPSLNDWQILKEFVIANNGSASTDENAIKEGVGESLKDTTTWQESSTPGTDRFGFAAKGAGVVTSGGTSREKNVFGIMHIAAEQPCGDKTFDDGRGCLNADSVAMDNIPVRADFRYDQSSLRYLQSKSYYRKDYMSVRCVMDPEGYTGDKGSYVPEEETKDEESKDESAKEDDDKAASSEETSSDDSSADKTSGTEESGEEG